jgi:hypothetical protein
MAYDLTEHGIADLHMLQDCFCIERFHLTTKPIMENIKNLRRYEYSVLAGVANAQKVALQNSCKSLASGALLALERAELEGFPDAHIARHLIHAGKHISVKDVCLKGARQALVVDGCVEEHGQFYVIGNECTFLEQVSAHSASYHRCRTTALWEVESTRLAGAWKMAGDYVLIIDHSIIA